MHGALAYEQGAPALLVLHTQQCRIACDVGKARRSTLRGPNVSADAAKKRGAAETPRLGWDSGVQRLELRQPDLW